MKHKAAAALIVLASQALAAGSADKGYGKINIQGVVIDAPCSLAAESAAPEVYFGQLSSASLRNGKESPEKAFQLRLENCMAGVKQQVRIIFKGTAYPDGLFAVEAGNQSIGIALRDRQGGRIANGQPVAWQQLSDGDNLLQFSAAVKGRAATIVAGDFQAHLLFTLEYQ